MVERQQIGLFYQDVVASWALVQLLAGRWETVACEHKRSEGDEFDDVWIGKDDEVVQLQMKHTYPDGEFPRRWLTSDTRGLGLAKLAKSWDKLRAEADRSLRIIVVTTAEPDGNLPDHLRPASSLEALGLEQPTFRIDEDFLQEHEGVAEKLEQKLSDDEISAFLDKLEFAFRIRGVSWTEEDTKGGIEEEESFRLLEEEINDKLPVGRHPALEDPTRLAQRIRSLAKECRLKGDRWTRSHVLRELQIPLEFHRLDEEFVPTEEETLMVGWVEDILDSQLLGQNDRLVVRGAPGSGKSHGLWLLAQEWEHDGAPAVVEHYCQLPDAGPRPEEDRVLLETVSTQLVDAIRREAPDLFDDSIPATDLDGLQLAVDRLGEFASDRGETVPVIVDGIDHAPRLKEHDPAIAEADETVVDLLNRLEIPDGVCLGFDSKRGLTTPVDPKHQKMDQGM